jgi:hypothetical protein
MVDDGVLEARREAEGKLEAEKWGQKDGAGSPHSSTPLMPRSAPEDEDEDEYEEDPAAKPASSSTIQRSLLLLLGAKL